MPKVPAATKRSKRYARVAQLVRDGFNNAEIGEMLVPKVSRQAVRQMRVRMAKRRT